MRYLVCLTFLVLLPIYLLLAQNTDKSAATTDIIMGFTDEFQNPENNLKYFSKDLVIFWQGGGKGKNGFRWIQNNYASSRERFKSEASNVVIRELNDETFAFFTWKATTRKNEKYPESVGKSAIGPVAYRMVWEGDQIKEWHIFVDQKSREKQLGILK